MYSVASTIRHNLNTLNPIRSSNRPKIICTAVVYSMPLVVEEVLPCFQRALKRKLSMFILFIYASHVAIKCGRLILSPCYIISIGNTPSKNLCNLLTITVFCHLNGLSEHSNFETTSGREWTSEYWTEILKWMDMYAVLSNPSVILLMLPSQNHTYIHFCMFICTLLT